MGSSHDRIREAGKTLFAQRGYEPTSTAAICRMAGTSESQLVKHFGNKQGVLEAVFQSAWDQLVPAIRLAIRSLSGPGQKLSMTIEMTLNFLGQDEELLTLFLLEGRRVRDSGHQVVLVPGFLEFVKILDEIIEELGGRGELAVHPQALRSALMGAVEGLLRDRALARSMHYPANFSDAEIRSVCFKFLNAALSNG